jgi:hypothetical protein
MSLGAWYERPAVPYCPHTVTLNGVELHTCSRPMVEVGWGVFECPNDHRGRRVKKQPPSLFPDLPREEPVSVEPVTAEPRGMSSPWNPGARPPVSPDPVGANKMSPPKRTWS